jgi:hypothetical protein
MEFNTPYKRADFVKFLRTKFLPEDFVQKEEQVTFLTQTNFAKSAVKLGECESLDLVVYEVKHTSLNDARVGLSKDAFRMLADEDARRALVIFVPESSNDNYRFSLVELTLSQKDDSSKVSTTYSNPRRFSYYLGKDIAYYTPNKYLNEAGRVNSPEDLRGRFSVEVLTKAFYQEISDWHAWAIKTVHYPNDIEDPLDNEKYNHTNVIRLITRLIFVWFLKQRKLIPNEFFDEEYIAEHLIKDFRPNNWLFGRSEESHYYKGILQNLFFAMLNSPITAEGSKELNQRRFRDTSTSDFDNTKLMCYQSLFSDPQLFIDLANSTVPFLNGGLFDCLDDKTSKMYLDGFTDDEKISSQLVIPDYLFFGHGNKVDLSEWYGDSKKRVVLISGIIDILKRYNFTVEENTPFDQDVSLDPELLGKVFENLLASFNPETRTTARKQTGSFYTPREVVHFMVDESLIEHLCRTVSKDLEPEFRKLVQYTDEDLHFTPEERKAIVKALYDCKVLDPACGSGAFPVGVLQQMVHILNRVDPDNRMWREMMIQSATSESSKAFSKENSEERDELLADIKRSFDEKINRPDYARKLYLIENCIYGIDIQPIAIQISKLRFFISLVVDQIINNNPADNFGIRPLPNLEAKFVSANTLIGLHKNDYSLFDIKDIKDKEDELKDAKHKIFNSKTVRTKRKWKERVAALRQKIADLLLEHQCVGNNTAIELASWDMFDQNTSSPFFDPEWMFGLTDGFDIVIGNPPYIQLQKATGRKIKGKKGKVVEEKLGDLFVECNYETFEKTGDIYCLFYEKGVSLLKPEGILCYITSNKWMRAAYGKSLREFFAEKTNPVKLIDLTGVRVFENATVEVNILLLKNEANANSTIACKIESADGVKNMSVYVLQEGELSQFNSSESWTILSALEQNIKNKIESRGVPLKEWNIKINYGIKTGLNEAFIITSEEKKEILKHCSTKEERQRTAELIRPILRGRDIERYSYNWADLYLIATFPSRHYDIEDYPSVKSHLLSFGKDRLEQSGKKWLVGKEQVQARKKTNNKWFEVQDSINYWEEFSKPKIVYREISTDMMATIVPGGWFITNKLYMVTGKLEDLEYICAFLNSKLFTKIVLKSVNFGGGKGADFLENIKLPKPPLNGISKLSDSEIDAYFCNLFNLNKEETKFIQTDQ